MMSLFVAMLIERLHFQYLYVNFSYIDAITENSAVINPYQLEDFLTYIFFIKVIAI